MFVLENDRSTSGGGVDSGSLDGPYRETSQHIAADVSEMAEKLDAMLGTMNSFTSAFYFIT